MEVALCFIVGLLMTCSVYLMLSRNLLRFIFGLALISNAANLLIFVGGRLTRGEPPLVAGGLQEPAGIVANALPQALILTAIVIGFGLFAFAISLTFRAYRDLETLDGDSIRIAEPLPDGTTLPKQTEERS